MTEGGFDFDKEWEEGVACVWVMDISVSAGPAEAGTPTWVMECGRVGVRCLGF